MRPQAARAYVLFVANLTRVRPLVRVEPLVEFQVYELGELGRAEVAGVRLLARVQPQVRLEVRRRAEPLLANVALVWLFTCKIKK